MLSSTVHSPLVGLNSTISSISPELCPPENLVMNFMSSKAKLFPDIKNHPAVNVRPSETTARSWKLPSEEPGGSCLHQQLGGGEEVTIMAIWLAPSDEVSLTHDDVTIFTIQVLP